MSDGGRVAEGDLDLLGDRAGDHCVLDHGFARDHLGTISFINARNLEVFLYTTVSNK